MGRFRDILHTSVVALAFSSIASALGPPLVSFTSSRGSIQLAGPNANAILVADGRGEIFNLRIIIDF